VTVGSFTAARMYMLVIEKKYPTEHFPLPKPKPKPKPKYHIKQAEKLCKEPRL